MLLRADGASLGAAPPPRAAPVTAAQSHPDSPPGPRASPAPTIQHSAAFSGSVSVHRANAGAFAKPGPSRAVRTAKQHFWRLRSLGASWQRRGSAQPACEAGFVWHQQHPGQAVSPPRGTAQQGGPTHAILLAERTQTDGERQTETTPARHQHTGHQQINHSQVSSASQHTSVFMRDAGEKFGRPDTNGQRGPQQERDTPVGSGRRRVIQALPAEPQHPTHAAGA